MGGFFSFQPSEFVKIGLALVYASILSKLKDKGKIKQFLNGCIKPLLLFVPIAIIMIHWQNHASATVIMAAIIIVEMFIANIPFINFIGAGILGSPLIAWFVKKKIIGSDGEGFRLERLKTWFNIESDLTGKGWQINQSLYAIGSGKLFGVGLGNSNQKYLYIPEPHNDFIFAVIAEETGFVGCMLVIILFAVFIWRGFLISTNAEDTFGTLLAIGLTTMIGLQMLINIAVVTNTMPVTGMPLPFFSYGGSAMIADLIAVGLLLNVSRNKRVS